MALDEVTILYDLLALDSPNICKLCYFTFSYQRNQGKKNLVFYILT